LERGRTFVLNLASVRPIVSPKCHNTYNYVIDTTSKLEFKNFVFKPKEVSRPNIIHF